MDYEIIYTHNKNGYAKISDGKLLFLIPNRLKNNATFRQSLLEKGQKLRDSYQKKPAFSVKGADFFYLFGEKITKEENTDFSLLFSSSKKLDDFLRSELLSFITPGVEKYASLVQKEYHSITIRKVKRKWGSCSHDQKLVFNFNLVHLPTRLIKYVIIHEVCHLVQKNHAVAFRSLVEKYCPEYKKLRKELKEFHIV